MSRPPKPFTVLKSEKKSHRTKAELKVREQGEESLASGVSLKSTPAVRNNKVAKQEFDRLNKLLIDIEKNDALYEGVINRYCLISAECVEMEERREFFFNLIKELKKTFKEQEIEDSEKKAVLLIEFSKEIARISSSMMSIDKVLQTKRKMLLDIEKENVMTIASSLRSIPKKVDKKENPLLKALQND